MVRKPADELAVALRELRIAPSAKITFERFPVLGIVSEALAWYLTNRIMVPMPAPMQSSLPLVQLCISCAFDWMAYAADKPEVTAKIGQTAYIAGLLYHTPELKHVTVSSTEGEEWYPYYDGPLGDWLQRNPDAVVDLRIPTESELRLTDGASRYALLAAMFPGSELSGFGVPIVDVLNPPDDMVPPRARDGQQ